jgi:hypothetical protein
LKIDRRLELEDSTTNKTHKKYNLLKIFCITALIVLIVINIEGVVTDTFNDKFSSYNTYVNAIKNNSDNNTRTGDIGNFGIDFFKNDFFNVILNSSLLIAIPTALIYYFGILYNSRTINRSKEDICHQGFHFVVFFVIAPLIFFYIIDRIGLIYFLQWLLQSLLAFFKINLNFFKIALITITAQFFILLTLLYVLWDSDNILKKRLYKWHRIESSAKKMPDYIFKYFPKINVIRKSSEEKDDVKNLCSPLKKCADGRCLTYCIFFLIFSCTTILLTLYCIFYLKVGTLLMVILFIMSFFILSLIACCLPSIFNVVNPVTVFLPECHKYLFGQIEQNTDSLVRIYDTKTGERIEINKKYIGFIKTSADISWKKMFLECILFWFGIWVTIFLIIATILLLTTKSSLYAFICALVISIFYLRFLIHYSDVEADYETSCPYFKI